MFDMSERQSQVLEFIERFFEEKGYPPTRAEIAEAFGWASPNAAQAHISALVRKGRLIHTPGVSRGLRVA